LPFNGAGSGWWDDDEAGRSEGEGVEGYEDEYGYDDGFELGIYRDGINRGTGGGEDDDDGDEDECDIDEDEVFDLIRSISDPEHPRTLEELAVVSRKQVKIIGNKVFVEYTPTTPACGMASIIGLSIVVRLVQSLPPRLKIRMSITPGSYGQAKQVSKQLNDKERVAAAMEVPAIMGEIDRCLVTAWRRGNASEV